MSELITTREKQRLERKAKVGWAAYFALSNKTDELREYCADMNERNYQLVKELRNEQETSDDKHNYLKKEFLEMYDVLKKFTECPVCYETIKKDTAKVGNCGHIVCKDCYEKLNECPICRKRYYKVASRY